MSVTPRPTLVARSISSAATITTRTGSDDSAGPSESSLDDYSFGTSKIVRIAIVSGVIVLVITALVLFFKVTAWIRYYNRQRRQIATHQQLQNEQRENAYEIAAWQDEPGSGPIIGGQKGESEKKKSKKLSRRGAANAYGVSEWEGVAQ